MTRAVPDLAAAIAKATARSGHPAKIGAPTRARARALPRGSMNKLEERYAAYCELRKRAGEIADWRYEAFTLKLAHDTRYTPDFWILELSGEQTFVDTKGTKTEDGVQKPFIPAKNAQKIRVAAALFPWFRFQIVFERGTKQSPIWSAVEVSA